MPAGLTGVISTVDDCKRLVVAAVAHGEVGCYENKQELPFHDLVLLGECCYHTDIHQLPIHIIPK